MHTHCTMEEHDNIHNYAACIMHKVQSTSDVVVGIGGVFTPTATCTDTICKDKQMHALRTTSN